MSSKKQNFYLKRIDRRGKKSAHNPRTMSEGSLDYRPEGASLTAFLNSGTEANPARPDDVNNDKVKREDAVYRKLMDYALFILGLKRYTCKEMRKKLEQRYLKKIRAGEKVVDAAGAEAIARVIGRLEGFKYLNDEEYLADFVQSRMKARPRGINALKYELRRKGIENGVIEKYFSENEFDEGKIALRLASAKLERLGRVPDEKKRSKIIMFLNSRGIKANIIYDTIEKLFNARDR